MSALTVRKGRPKKAEKPPRLMKWGVALVDAREQPIFLVAYASDDEGARARLARRAEILLAQMDNVCDQALLKAWLRAFADRSIRPYGMVAECGAVPRWYPEKQEETA